MCWWMICVEVLLADEQPQRTQASRSDARVGVGRAGSRTCITNNQCQNGGTCFARACICRPGYQGPTCNQRQYHCIATQSLCLPVYNVSLVVITHLVCL